MDKNSRYKKPWILRTKQTRVDCFRGGWRIIRFVDSVYVSLDRTDKIKGIIKKLKPIIQHVIKQNGGKMDGDKLADEIRSLGISVYNSTVTRACTELWQEGSLERVTYAKWKDETHPKRDYYLPECAKATKGVEFDDQ